MCFRNRENVIANSDCLASDAIHVIGINDQRPVESDEINVLRITLLHFYRRLMYIFSIFPIHTVRSAPNVEDVAINLVNHREVQ